VTRVSWCSRLVRQLSAGRQRSSAVADDRRRRARVSLFSPSAEAAEESWKRPEPLPKGRTARASAACRSGHLHHEVPKNGLHASPVAGPHNQVRRRSPRGLAAFLFPSRYTCGGSAKGTFESPGYRRIMPLRPLHATVGTAVSWWMNPRTYRKAPRWSSSSTTHAPARSQRRQPSSTKPAGGGGGGGALNPCLRRSARCRSERRSHLGDRRPSGCSRSNRTGRRASSTWLRDHTSDAQRSIGPWCQYPSRMARATGVLSRGRLTGPRIRHRRSSPSSSSNRPPIRSQGRTPSRSAGSTWAASLRY